MKIKQSDEERYLAIGSIKSKENFAKLIAWPGEPLNIFALGLLDPSRLKLCTPT